MIDMNKKKKKFSDKSETITKKYSIASIHQLQNLYILMFFPKETDSELSNGAKNTHKKKFLLTTSY